MAQTQIEQTEVGSVSGVAVRLEGVVKRFGDVDTPSDIMRSIQERSVTDEELGMFWRDLELSWWWFRAPIETLKNLRRYPTAEVKP